MKKRFTKLLVLLLILSLNAAFAQQNPQHLFDKYINGSLHYDPAMFYTDQKFYSSRHLPDSLNIEVKTPTDVRQIIKSGLQNRTYGVSIEHHDTTDLNTIVELLAAFPHLNYLKIQDLGLFNVAKRAVYKLPESIKRLQHLNGLTFSFTQSIDMADAIGKLASLKHLQGLDFIAYPKPLPALLSSLKNIKVVSLSSGILDSIDLKKVKWQIVSLNGVAPKTGPDELALEKLSNVSSLRKLYLEYCMLGSCNEIASFKQLSSLSIISCEPDRSVQLFEKLSKLTSLETLIVSGVRDTSQSLNGIEKLTGLRTLKLAGMQSLKLHPKELSNLRGLGTLQSLVLNSLELKMIPDVFAWLKQLKSLTMEGNDFTEMPESIFRLPDLEYLDLSSNKLRELPVNTVYGCTKLKKLKLKYNSLASLPKQLLSLTRLQYIDASANKISKIPEKGWQNLKELTYVNFSTNYIPVFPDGLQQITSLETLELADNNISIIPDLKGEAYRVKRLNISSNELTLLPEHIGKYTSLEYLNAAGNMLTDLPASLGNCKKLIELDLHSESRKTSYDMDKPMNERFGITEKNDVRLNSIKTLPEGLKDAAKLYQLNLSGNKGINSASVFKVILGTPRADFFVNLNGDNIQVIPASKHWAEMEFYDLDLGRNNLTVLPADFAYIKKFHNIYLNHNPIGTNSAVGVETISSSEDMKLLFEEMDIPLSNFKVSNAGYAAALAKRVNDAYYKNSWAKAVEYANKAIATDSVAYAQEVKWEEIAVCRYNLKDYEGAIHDFGHFIIHEEKTGIHWGPSLTLAEEYKANAHLALGQKEKAAQTHLYFARRFGNTSGLQEAAILYKLLGNEPRYNRLMDSAVLAYQERLNSSLKYNPKYSDPALILDYAELLIMAAQVPAAIKLINDQNPKSFQPNQNPIKNYLLATARSINDPKSFPQLKQSLTDEIKAGGKITGWDFTMFNSWLTSSNFPADKKNQLLVLQNIAK